MAVAKESIMDYLFRWMQLRFLSGHQLDLFANLRPAALTGSPAPLTLAPDAFSVPVAGAVVAPDNMIVPSAQEPTAPAPAYGLSAPQPAGYGDPSQLIDRRPPASGIAPDLNARSGMEASSGDGSASLLGAEDRGIYHAADAMKGMYDLGDAPSCSTCGAIMVRNGACHRCMECGSTSGCS
jgi:ribonucleoside-diphosphate reductase alpha chain